MKRQSSALPDDRCWGRSGPDGLGRCGSATITSSATALPGRPMPAALTLKLKKGDHIAILGNTLADRMQHDGWLETLIYAKFPQHDLVFRNLAAAGDEVGTWHRSENFGSPRRVADQGQGRRDLRVLRLQRIVQGRRRACRSSRRIWTSSSRTRRPRTTAARAPPRVVLFSPIADEKIARPQLPRPGRRSTRISSTTPPRWPKWPRRNGVQFVDLFDPSQQLYAEAAKAGQVADDQRPAPHRGGRQAARAGSSSASSSAKRRPTGDLEKLRAADHRQERRVARPLPHRRRLQRLRRPLAAGVTPVRPRPGRRSPTTRSCRRR